MNPRRRPPGDIDPMAIAARKGSFVVSLRYRDDNLRLRCANLVKAGLMRRDGRIENGRAEYVLTEAGRKVLAERGT